MSDQSSSRKQGTARPHYVSIGLSLFALVVAGLSWWEAHNARLGNETSNRALAYLTDFRNIAPADKPDPPVYKMTVKNFGRSAASVVVYKLYFTVGKDYSDQADYQDKRDRVVDYDMPAGHQKEVVLDIPWAKIPQPQDGEFRFVHLTLEYLDEPTGKNYSQMWCFKLETSQNGLEPCEVK